MAGWEPINPSMHKAPSAPKICKKRGILFQISLLLFLTSPLTSPSSEENFTQICLNPFSQGSLIHFDHKNPNRLNIFELTFEYILIIHNLWKVKRKRNDE